MTSTFPQRVAFEDHRLMQARDLEDEQLYHLQRRWQHNLALHSWGILCGLEVTVGVNDSQQLKITVHPGMALDGYGRELVVARVLEPTDYLSPAKSYDLWLEFNYTFEASQEPADDTACLPADTGLRRIAEQPLVRVRETAERVSGDVTRPPGVPLGDLYFSPEQPMKFDPAAKWPVFLCRLEFVDKRWRVDPTERHYAGLIAERIEVPVQRASSAGSQASTGDAATPARRTAIINGGHPDRSEWRFAVLDEPSSSKSEQTAADNRRLTLPDDVPAPLSIRTVKPPTAQPKDKPTVGNDKPPQSLAQDTEIRWQAERIVVEGDMTLLGGAGLQFEATPPGQKPIEPTTGWGIYRNFRPPSSEPAGDANANQFADVLQISMPDSGKGWNSVAIGAVDAAGKFTPIVEVRDDSSVDITGDLRVHGEVYAETSDLPPINRPEVIIKLSESIQKALKDGLIKSETIDSLAGTIFPKASPKQIGVSLATITEDEKKKEVFTPLIEPIVSLAQDNEFAGSVATCIENGNGRGQENLYKSLAGPIVKLADEPNTNVFAKEFSLAFGEASSKHSSGFEILCKTLLANAIAQQLTPESFLSGLKDAPDKTNLKKIFSELWMHNSLAKTLAIAAPASSGAYTAFTESLPVKVKPQLIAAIAEGFEKLWSTERYATLLAEAVPKEAQTLRKFAEVLNDGHHDEEKNALLVALKELPRIPRE